MLPVKSKFQKEPDDAFWIASGGDAALFILLIVPVNVTVEPMTRKPTSLLLGPNLVWDIVGGSTLTPAQTKGVLTVWTWPAQHCPGLVSRAFGTCPVRRVLHEAAIQW